MLRISHLATAMVVLPFRTALLHRHCISMKSAQQYEYLVETLGRRHRSLDRQAAHVLPALLQERDKVVDGQHDVRDQLVLSHVNVANRNTHTQDLLQLELDGGLDFVDLGAQIFVVGDWGGELASLGKTRTQETRNLLDKSVGSDEGIVLACELLDQLLVLVELLQIIRRHGINTTVLGTIDIMLVTENADAHVWAGDDWKTDGSGETLVTLGIIVLEADLEFDGFEEVTLLRLEGVLKKFLDVATHSGDCDFRHDDSLPVEFLRF